MTERIPSFSASFSAVFLTQDQKTFLQEHAPDLLKVALEKINKLLPEKTIYCNVSLAKTELVKADNEFDFLVSLSTLLPPSLIQDEDIDEAFFCYCKGIMPLLDLQLSNEMLSKHIRYLSQYTWSENIPTGLVPIFISREFIATLPAKTLSPHDFLIKNINQYDVEIFYKPPDLRQYRLDFTLSGPRSLALIRHFLKKEIFRYEDILEEIKSHSQIFRPFPSWIELEIFHGCDYFCSFCPRQFQNNDKDGIFLTLEDIHTIRSGIESMTGEDITICLGGMGEPTLHNDFPAICNLLASIPSVREIIVETSLSRGLDNLKATWTLLNDNERNKISIIINITTLNREKYTKLYGKDALEKTLREIQELSELYGKNKIHVQMIKMKEVEEETENYFNYFEKIGLNVILQKYNRYASLMPEKRVSDLTPVKRDFCWHLIRDMYIRADGNASICRITMDDSMGNIKQQSFASIWQNGLETAKHSLNENHTNIPAPCLNCDEWYTFNG